MTKNLCLAIMAASIPFASNAAVEKVSFSDVSGASQERSISQNNEIFINNNSSVAFYVSSGLDRRLRFVLKKGNTVVSDSTTDVINIDDLIKHNGKSYYGKVFNADISSDATYSIEVSTLALDSSVIDTESYIVSRDTTPPTSGNVTISSYGGTTNALTPSDIWYTGYYSQNYFQVSDILDNSSGISKVELVSYTTEGGKSEYKRKTVAYDANQKLARFNFNTDSRFLPNGDNAETIFGVEFHITDRAGNTYRTQMQKLYYDTVGSKGLELIAYREPGSKNVIGGQEGYVPYVPGSTVNENPISIMYRLPASEYKSNRRGGYGPVGHSKVITDQNDGFYYVIFTRPFGFTNGNHVRFTDQRTWTTSNISYNLKLSSSAPKAPVRVGSAEYLWSDIGWASWNRWLIQNTQLPITITGSRQRVEPRPYVQRWSHSGHECFIPAGEEYCEIHHPAKTLAKGSSGYFHEGSTIESADKSLYGEPSWADATYNDQHYPIINSISQESLSLVANIEQPAAGSWFDHLRLKDVWIEDENGKRLSINRTSLARNGIYYEAKFDLNTLEEGEHDLFVVALENHGPKTKKAAFKYLSDRSAPELSITYHGEDTPDTIANLRDLVININDNLTEVKIEQISLKSTDGLVDVVLGYTLKSESNAGLSKKYSPELPRLFPTLDEGITYKMNVQVSDAYGNRATMEKTFMYVPDNLIQMGVIQYLPVDRVLLDANDDALAKITSNELKLDDGRMATGEQKAFVSLKASAEYAVLVNSDVVVKPGETKEITIDLGDTGGKLNIPIHPEKQAQEGVSSILFEIPQLKSKYDN
ncbi:Ig-like domain repeat protein [Vibrio parahaemolyticus]|nr:Ig-like domain repeat protein [Vibrio parahaemolyticus]